MSPDDLRSLTITGAGRLLRARKLSSMELTRACLDRIQQLDGTLKAFITVTADLALAQARRADREIAKRAYRGPLHGIPVTLKDIYCTRGIRTTAGSRILGDFVPSADATATARLAEAGAVLVGKTNLHEFAAGVTSDNPHFGTCQNPWKLGYIPGGSSGGSAAAVAAGLDPCFVGVWAEAAHHHRAWLLPRPQDYGADVAGLLKRALLYLATDYLQAQRVRARIRHSLSEVFRRVDVLVSPATPLPATPIGRLEVPLKSRTVSVLDVGARLTCVANL